jgi:hypothetical protein
MWWSHVCVCVCVCVLLVMQEKNRSANEMEQATLYFRNACTLLPG